MLCFNCGFGSDVLFTIDHLRSISFFCQNAHHDWLTKEYMKPLDPGQSSETKGKQSTGP